MHNLFQILKILSDGKFHSGEKLGNELGITRTAIWKLIRRLTEFGLDVHAVRGKGYRLSAQIELLDRREIDRNISEQARELINQFEIFSVIDSTNQYLLDKLNSDEIHGHVVLAEFQTKGRGRRGNKWISPIGSGINLSFGWHFDELSGSMGVLSLVIGVAIIRVLNRAGIKGVGLKWPNDILWKTYKLGGVLLEIQGETTGPFNTVFGIGININFHGKQAEEIDQPWIDIARISQDPPSRNELVANLITESLLILEQFSRDGYTEILNEWRQYDFIQGQQAILTLPGRQIQGQVIGIDEQGALLMSVQGKKRRFSAGEIKMRATNESVS
jgi:BirA family biotin operon repressor/biotin-[acetyl-CoA-carboxylase] ligase